jgi:Cellulase (glycosyl hydrolase family 5)
MKRLLPLLLTALVLLPTSAAHARSTEIGITDDRILLPGGPKADQAVAEWVKLGVDNVRIFAHWGKIAPKTRPAGWDADNPASPGYQWFYVDEAVNRVRRAGMSVTLTITGPGPVWSSSKPKRRSGAYKPRASAYAAFAKAVALKFGDRVDRYILWNEPNIHTWLMPQAKCKRGRCTPVSPHLYRGLARAAYPAVKAADPRAQVVIGTLSPRGQRLRNAKTVMRPLLFLRRLGCRTDGFKRMRSGACKRFKPATGDGFAIHPYSSTFAPTRAHPNPDDVSLGSLSRLTKTLDRLQRKKALKATTRRFGVYVDEYGYQTRPPDPIAGVTLSRQDRWLQEAAYVAWRNSRVRLLTQYLWRDEPPSSKGSYGGWQSGLRFASRRAKPSLAHFDTPFWVDGDRNRLWGQIRPGGRHTLTVQSRRDGAGKKWRKLATVTTDARGYFQLTRKLKAKTRYRFVSGGVTSAALRP